MSERANRAALLNLINEPVHLGMSADGARHLIVPRGSGVPLERALRGQVLEQDWVEYTVAPPMPELVLAPGPEYTTSHEQITRIANIDQSYMNRTVNKELRGPNQNIDYIIYHTTISAAWRTNPYAVLNYLLTPHEKPQGLIQSSTTWLLPATDLPDGKGGRNWRMFKYISDNYIAYHAGKGKIADPITGQVFQNSMNERSIGIEVDNDGRNPITQEQFSMLVYLSMKYHHDNNVSWKRMIGHKEWAPGRKFDPQAACYSVANVLAESQRLYKEFYGNDWEAPNPQPEDPNNYMTIRDGYRSNVREDYKATSPVRLKLEQGIPFNSIKTYLDGMAVNGSRFWLHVTHVDNLGQHYDGPGFIHGSRVVALEHPQIFLVRPGNNEVKRIAGQLQTTERVARAQNARPIEILYECC